MSAPQVWYLESSRLDVPGGRVACTLVAIVVMNFKKRQKANRANRKSTQRRRSLHLESLEDRRVLATFVVTTPSDVISNGCDEFSCSLRDAVSAANSSPGADTIAFADKLFTDPLIDQQVTVASEIKVTESLTIKGRPDEKLTLNGTGFGRFFSFGGSATETFVLEDLTLSGGRGLLTGPGGAIRFGQENLDTNGDDSLLLNRVVIRDSLSTQGAGVHAIGGTLTITDSSFVSNRTSGNTRSGSAIARFGGTTTIINSTFSDNSAEGGVITASATSGAQSVKIINSTFADNTDTQSFDTSVLRLDSDLAEDTVTIEIGTSLFSGNSGDTISVDSSNDGSATVVSLGNNLSDRDASAFLSHETDQNTTNAQIGPLDPATLTHTPTPGSPAIDSGAQVGGDIPATDQLGNPRQAGSGVDIGSVEVAFEYGDAPTATQTGFESSYPTLFADGGAVHRFGGPRLGSTVDTEGDGQPSGSAMGDDNSFTADEDGISFVGGEYHTLGDELTIVVDLQNADPTSNYLDAWVDWNRNGNWDDEGEQFATSFDLGTVDGTTPIDLDMPADLEAGALFFRFRVSTTGGLSPGGMAEDGEVEDYRIAVLEDQFSPVVDNATDESDGNLAPGDVSLREAIEYANTFGGVDTIAIAPSLAGETISLSLGQLVLTQSLSIIGTGSSDLTIDAGGTHRIFDIAGQSVDVTLEGISLTGGMSADQGGAIRFDSLGDLTLRDVAITASKSQSDGGAIYGTGGDLFVYDTKISGNEAAGKGGAIHLDRGELALTRSTLSDNKADGDGGGLYSNRGEVNLTQTTVSGNTSMARGGGIATSGVLSGNLTTTITQSTISGNNANSGGGIYNLSGLTTLVASTVTENNATDQRSGIVSLGNTTTRTEVQMSIVAGNDTSDVDSINTTVNGINSFQSNGYNLIGFGDALDAFLPETNDTTDVDDPGLAPLADYGGGHETHALLPTSVAIDAGSSSLLPADRLDVDGDGDTDEAIPSDARGVERLIDIPGTDNADDGVDIGAFEAITLSIGDATANEAAGSIVFTLTLSHPVPEGTAQTVTVQTQNSSAEAGSDFTGLFQEVIALPTDGTLTTTVSVSLQDDALIESDEEFSLFVSSEGSVIVEDFAGIGTIQSDDQAGFSVSKTLASVSESGQTDSFEVVLTAQPTSNVVIEVTQNRNDEIQINAGTLTFTSDNWNTPQTINVTGRNDEIIDGDQATLVNLSIDDTRSDADFAGLDDQLVTVTSLDNDVAGITVTPLESLTVNESGTTATFAVRLDSLPTADVTITLTSSDETEGTIDTQTLTFTPANATTSQTVTVTGLDDDVADGNVNFTIRLDALQSSDNDYDGLQPASVSVVNLDNDQLDFGDAPDPTYPTFLASDGARHVTGSLTLGTTVDVESDAHQSALVDGDSGDDGVTPLTSILATTDSVSRASLLVNASQAGKLDAWIDFDANGDWEGTSEQIAASFDLVAGDNILTFNLPPGTTAGDLAARFRVSTAGGLRPNGLAADGEVEDYLLTVLDTSTSQTINVTPIGGDANISYVGTDLVISSNGSELLRSTVTNGSTVNVTGTDADNTLSFDTSGGTSLGLRFDAGDGEDTIRLEQPDVSLFLPGLIGVVTGLEVLDISVDGSATVTMTEAAVTAITDAENTLTILMDSADTLNLESGAVIASTDVIDGVFYQTVALGDATLRFAGGSPWTNTANNLDVNNSGTVTQIDALIILNELLRRTYIENAAQLTDATSLDPFPNLFFDTNGDGLLTPNDALRVINFINSGNAANGELLPSDPEIAWYFGEDDDAMEEGNEANDAAIASLF